MDTAVYWGITPHGWRRAASPGELPASTAGFVRVERCAGADGAPRAYVVETATRHGERADWLTARFGHPPSADVPDGAVAEATECADRVIGPRHTNPAAWDKLRDAILAALDAGEPRPGEERFLERLRSARPRVTAMLARLVA